MVTKIISCADIHIRNYKRLEEYREQLKKFIDECKMIAEENGAENTRIVVAGDLLHNKLDISGEGYVMASQFIKALDGICKTIIIGGNHDMNMSNLSRLDPVSAIFDMCDFEQTYFLDNELNYESGCVVDDNIVWCLYSSFDNFSKPNIDEYRINHPDNTFIGLFHGELKSAKTDAGYATENGLDVSYFSNVDFCICGHIHKRQKINFNGTTALYIGSLIQQDHGENINNHGFVVIDVETLTYSEHNIKNDRGFYTFTITSESDIDEDKEELINY